MLLKLLFKGSLISRWDLDLYGVKPILPAHFMKATRQEWPLFITSLLKQKWKALFSCHFPKRYGSLLPLSFEFVKFAVTMKQRMKYEYCVWQAAPLRTSVLHKTLSLCLSIKFKWHLEGRDLPDPSLWNIKSCLTLHWHCFNQNLSSWDGMCDQLKFRAQHPRRHFGEKS